MNLNRVKNATKIFTKILFKIGVKYLKIYLFKLAIGIIIPTGLITLFQGIITLFSEKDNIS